MTVIEINYVLKYKGDVYTVRFMPGEGWEIHSTQPLGANHLSKLRPTRRNAEDIIKQWCK